MPVSGILQNGIPGDVAGEEIGRELDPLVVEFERLGESLDQFRFPESGKTFEQDMPPGYQPGNDEVDQVLLAEEDLSERGGQIPEASGMSGDGGFLERHVGIQDERRCDCQANSLAPDEESIRASFGKLAFDFFAFARIWLPFPRNARVHRHWRGGLPRLQLIPIPTSWLESD